MYLNIAGLGGAGCWPVGGETIALRFSYGRDRIGATINRLKACVYLCSQHRPSMQRTDFQGSGGPDIFTYIIPKAVVTGGLTKTAPVTCGIFQHLYIFFIFIFFFYSSSSSSSSSSSPPSSPSSPSSPSFFFQTSQPHSKD